jgi:hypothetical protein
MKNLLLIAFATLALAMGANFIDACPNCEGTQVVKAEEKKAEKAEVKTEKAVATADVNAKGTATAKRASAGQAVKADRDCSGAAKRAAAGQAVAADGECCGGCCTKAEDGKGDCCGGCCNKKEGCEGKDCGSACGDKKDCGSGCGGNKAVKN